MNDVVSFRELLMMDVEVFHYIVDLVHPAILKQNTSMRACIPPTEPVAITLRLTT